MTAPRTAAGRALQIMLDERSQYRAGTGRKLIDAILTIEDEAGGLDVERLARAIDASTFYWNERPLADGSTEAVLDTERYARDIAAEYDRLTDLMENEVVADAAEPRALLRALVEALERGTARERCRPWGHYIVPMHAARAYLERTDG